MPRNREKKIYELHKNHECHDPDLVSVSENFVFSTVGIAGSTRTVFPQPKFNLTMHGGKDLDE